MSFKINALHISKELPLIKLKKILKYKQVQSDRSTTIYKLKKDSYLFAYSFGVLFFYNVKENQINEIIERIRNLGIKIFPEKIRDKYEEDYVVAKGRKQSVKFEEVHLKSTSLESIKVIAWVISRSVALDHYEADVDLMMEEFSKLNAQLKEKGKLRIGSKKLLKLIGRNNSIIEGMISKLSLLEEPACTWEEEKMDALFNSLYEMFEIEERFDTVEYKLKYIQNNSNILLEAIRNKKEVILEMTIIILIFIEVVMFAYELWPHFFS